MMKLKWKNISDDGMGDNQDEDDDNDYMIQTPTNSNGSLVPIAKTVDRSINHIERTRGKRKRTDIERPVSKRRKNN